jgi:NADH-quinone oxidoreductase subunit J
MIYFSMYFILLLVLFFCIFVILVKNPVVSVLFLIMVFFCSVLILIFLKAEFLGLLMLIVYVGAISILFLFVIMMLNLRIVELLDIFLHYFPIGGIIGFVFFVEIFFFFKSNFSIDSFYQYEFILDYVDFVWIQSNLLLLGVVLFNYNIFFIFFSGILLFISMIGSIMLTLEFSLLNEFVFEKSFLMKNYISF